MSLYKTQASPYWYYSILVAGKRYRGSTNERDKSAALAIEAAKRTELILCASRSEAREITVNDALTRYWDEYARSLSSAKTIDGINVKIATFFGESTVLTDITDNDIARWVVSLRGSISDTTINRYLANFRAIMRRAHDAWGVNIPSIRWKAHWQIEPEPPLEYLTKEQATALISAAPDHLKPVIEMALLSGMRYSNVVRLTWDQVNWSLGEIHVRVKSRRPGGKLLRLPITKQIDTLLRTKVGGVRESGRVFLRNGKPFDWCRRAYVTACKAAKLPTTKFHTLRHTSATWMVANGAPIDVVQKVLGHSSVQTTQRYARRTVEQMASAMDTLMVA